MRNARVPVLLASLVLAMAVSGADLPKDHRDARFGRNLKEMTFAPVPGMPTCSTGSVQRGDPAKGASFIAARLASGCVIPWHWHTPNEHLVMVSGVARLEMLEGATMTLKAGGFALMPTKHVHQFTCIKSCLLYVQSDAAFDLHYVNNEGREISPDDAMRRYGQTAARAPQ